MGDNDNKSILVKRETYLPPDLDAFCVRICDFTGRDIGDVIRDMVSYVRTSTEIKAVDTLERAKGNDIEWEHREEEDLYQAMNDLRPDPILDVFFS